VSETTVTTPIRSIASHDCQRGYLDCYSYNTWKQKHCRNRLKRGEQARRLHILHQKPSAVLQQCSFNPLRRSKEGKKKSTFCQFLSRKLEINYGYTHLIIWDMSREQFCSRITKNNVAAREIIPFLQYYWPTPPQTLNTKMFHSKLQKKKRSGN
jgi:hypothetical protein